MYQFAMLTRPLDPRTLIALAKLAVKRNEFEIAREFVKKIFSLYPNYKEAISMVPFIDSKEEKYLKKLSSSLKKNGKLQKKCREYDGFVCNNSILCENGKYYIKPKTSLFESNSFASRKIVKITEKSEIKIVSQIDNWVHVVVKKYVKK
jgi:hypothetical protein